jgi:hypothetical protein
MSAAFLDVALHPQPLILAAQAGVVDHQVRRRRGRHLRVGAPRRPSPRPLPRSHLGDLDVEVADWIGFELPLGGGLTFDLRQSGDAVALKAAMTASSAGSSAAGHTDSHPAEAACASKGDYDRFLLHGHNR